MHLHILGIGSIGTLVAHTFRNALPTTHSISLIHRTSRQHLMFLEKGSISLEHRGNVVNSTGPFIHEVSEYEDPKEKESSPPITTPIESLIVSLKAQYTFDAIRKIAPRLNSNSTIILLQNGMGMYELLSRKVFRNPMERPHFILASNTHGAFTVNPFHVVHAGIGTINFGIVPGPYGSPDFEYGLRDKKVPLENRHLRLSDITLPGNRQYERYKSLRESVAALLLVAKSLNCAWVPFSDLQVTMRRKLVVNAVINPLTSLLGCRNGDLFSHQPARRLLRQVCLEASYIFAMQHQAQIDSWLKEQNLDPATAKTPEFPRVLSSQSLEAEVIRVAEVTRGNISSMLQDTRRGRPTEIEFINGYLENLARELDIDTPVISMLRNLVDLKYFLPLNQML